MTYQVAFKPETPVPSWDSCLSELRQAVGSRISIDETERLMVGKDFWPITGTWLMQGKVPSLPDVVVWPESTEEVSQIISIANRYRIPIIPYGEGSGVLGGVVAINGGIVVDMKRMNKILDIDDKSLLLTVESGINGEILERQLNEKGYTLRHIPQSIKCSTVGGWVACRAAGQFSTKYGKIEDMLVGVEVVLPDGSIYRNTIAPRTATGPRLDQIFLGAEGTLGIVTQAVLRIHTLPESQTLRSFSFANVDDSLEAVRLIMRDNIRPAVVRIYDEFETDHHFKNIEAAHERVMLVLVMEGIPELVAVENQVAERHCLTLGGVDCGVEPVHHWFESRFNVSISSHLIQNNVVCDTIEVAGTWARINDIYHNTIKAIKEVPGTIIASGHFSHVYPDGACLYMSVAGVAQGDVDEYYKQIWNAAIQTTQENGGTAAHHHGVGLNRARFMPREHGTAGLNLLKELKKAWDPNNVMNPGKIGLGVE
ncbi:MAG: FAD-binding oxidoreductase [Acidobacteriota bacterium]